jgi:salicylate hydroxylase
MSTQNTPSILIVGAGLGGLTAGLALLKRGFPVRILEQATSLRELGAGIQLSPNVNRALYALGLGEALESVSSMAAGKKIRLWSTGQTWELFDLGEQALARYGYPYLTVYRADLHRLLVEAVRTLQADAIVLGARVESFSQDERQATAVLADGTTYTADLLIGADGIHSQVRSALYGDDRPRFSGTLAWRGVIAAQKLPEHLRQSYAVNWVGPGAHVIHYPLRSGGLVNFVGIRERDDWQVESWTEEGTIAECLQDFAGWHEDVLTLIRSLETPFKWALMLRDPLANWTRDRVTLLGDACHATLPMLASGAAMAIEDGYILARCLDEIGSPAEALRRYEALRKDRTTRVVLGSAENARRFHNPELAHAQGAADYVAREWTPERIHERYDWLFSYNVDEVEV